MKLRESNVPILLDTKQGRAWQLKCEKVSDQILDDEPLFFTIDEADDAFEDDGCLHVTKHGLRAVFGIGEDTPGKSANEKIRAILTALGMKRKISKRSLVEEECEECDSTGSVTCDMGCDHDCYDCDGTGFVDPEEN